MRRAVPGLLAVAICLQLTVIYRQMSGPPLRSRLSAVRDVSGSVSIAGMPRQGAETARVVIVEFADYECPYCRRHALNTMAEIQLELIEPGLIQYVFANNPLPNHPNAEYLARAALCGGREAGYWVMHAGIFEAEATTEGDVANVIGALGSDAEGVEACIKEDEVVDARLAADREIAEALGLAATPSFAVGLLRGEDTIEVRRVITGARATQIFVEAVAEVAATPE